MTKPARILYCNCTYAQVVPKEAKEAVLKVLGTGWRGGIAWTDIEILPLPSGQPIIQLTGECLRIATDLGIRRWHVSISHIETHATASAIGLRAE